MYDSLDLCGAIRQLPTQRSSCSRLRIPATQSSAPLPPAAKRQRASKRSIATPSTRRTALHALIIGHRAHHGRDAVAPAGIRPQRAALESLKARKDAFLGDAAGPLACWTCCLGSSAGDLDSLASAFAASSRRRNGTAVARSDEKIWH